MQCVVQQMAGYPGMIMPPHYPQVDASTVQMMQNLSLVHPSEQGRYMQSGMPGGMGLPGFAGMPYGYMHGSPSMPQAVPHSGMQVENNAQKQDTWVARQLLLSECICGLFPFPMSRPSPMMSAFEFKDNVPCTVSLPLIKSPLSMSQCASLPIYTVLCLYEGRPSLSLRHASSSKPPWAACHL